MLKRYNIPFHTLVLLALTIGIVLIASSVSFSADTYPAPHTAEVTLAWNTNDPAPEGYLIYQRTEGQVYDYNQPVWAGSATSGTVYNLDYDTTYYFVARAYVGETQSADSDEVSFLAHAPPPASHTIAVVAGSNGAVSPANTVTVPQGADQAFLILPDYAYQVEDVLVDGVSMGAVNTYTFDNIVADHTIGATFAPKTYTIAAIAGDNGTISPSGSVSVDHGNEKTYTITPNSGYFVADLLVDGVSMGSVKTYTFENIVSDHSITVSFAAGSFSISASAGVNGSVKPEGTVNVDIGASKTYAIVPDAGYHVADVKVDGVSIGALPSYTFSQVSADHTINATFAAETFAITATAGKNGNISPSGIVEATYGGSQRFTFGADSGFYIADVQVDGWSLGAIEAHTFTGIDANHTLEVTFSESNLVKIWIEAEDGDLQLPMEINDDENAGAGGYIWVPPGIGNLYSPSDNGGYAEYHFEIPETGDYIIWGRQISNDTASDSFFVSVDGQLDLAWHTKRGGQNVWTWDVVSLRNAQDPQYTINPELFRLTAGSHTLKIKQREDGTKLDRILITNQDDLTNPEPDSVIETMEFGDVQVNHNWTRVNFSRPFVNPVVVAGPISLNGGQPSVVRIQHVEATGFEIRLQEWEYQDGGHAIETVSYLVMEQGLYTLEDGTKIEAANTETSAAASFQEITFSENFNVAPVVTTAVISFNDSGAVTGRMKQITVDGFKYRMQAQEANTQDHGTEKLAYIAWEPSSGVMGGTTFVVENTADAVTHKPYGIMFERPFTSAPIFLADMQTANGGNTANVRCDHKGDLSVDVWIDEEQSKDTEAYHITEVVGYMAFSR